jgi:hypothetical protein
VARILLSLRVGDVGDGGRLAAKTLARMNYNILASKNIQKPARPKGAAGSGKANYSK